MEAKILFDADKLDVAGAMGIARTLVYKGSMSEPLYSVLPEDTEPSFFQEYKYKLEKMYSLFYTKKAMEKARERQQAAIDFYNCLYREADSAYKGGRAELDRLLSAK